MKAKPDIRLRGHAAVLAAFLASVMAYGGAAAAEIRQIPAPLVLDDRVSDLWEPVAAIGGQIFPDAPEEVVVVLHRRESPTIGDTLPRGSRGLAVFRLNDQGTYDLIAQADGVLPCVYCLGTLNRNPMANPVDIEIEDQRLTIGWISNKDTLIAVRLTFAWSEEDLAFLLVTEDLTLANSRTREIASRRIRDYLEGTETVNGQTRPIARRHIPMQQVKAQDYR